ncbi:hypothetical protein QFC19_004495 [Naganishia cerealis]|uniref:Uncharacterized protein n=1 Tax=Naganishia cerealis TaxID=610337 RepID=A0ACC2VU14_9TREE|nr:hypothetical protein QFC19_004495 [Naganishia cerealis]
MGLSEDCRGDLGTGGSSLQGRILIVLLKETLAERAELQEERLLSFNGLEAYGIFKVGEIIGRRNLVGYKLEE